MVINKKQQGGSLAIALSGRLDTMTAPKLEAELKDSIGGIAVLTFDFSELEYLSSAGLRVLLAAQKAMGQQGGSMVVRHANETIMEVFELTGFLKILTVEN